MKLFNKVYISAMTKLSGSLSAIGEVISNYWMSVLGNTQVDQGVELACDLYGNVYVIGRSTGVGSGGADLLIVKYDSSGTILWQRALGGASADSGTDITCDPSGNVYVTGNTASQGAGGNELLVVKYDSSGTILWQRALGGIKSDTGTGIACDPSGNVYVTGSTASQGAGVNDIIVVKYDSSGTVLWQRALGGDSNELGHNIACDSSGNVYVTGYTGSQGAGSNDIIVVKYNSSGTFLWQRALGGTNVDVGQGIACDTSGNVYVTGYINSQGVGNTDIVVVKYDSAGTILWQRALGDISADSGYGIACDASGNVYVSGSTVRQAPGDTDLVVVKYDSSGTVLWQRALGGIGPDVGYGIACDASGNVYVSGSQGVIIKYNPTGTLLWQKNILEYGHLAIDANYIYIRASDSVYRYGITGEYLDSTVFTQTTTTLTQTTTTLTQTTTTLTQTQSTLASTPTTLIGSVTDIPYGLVSLRIQL